jgi:tetratricopeptide (TPR) repeat protein
VVQLVEDAVELGDATAITAAQREAWLGPEPPLPAGALVSADGLLLWRGRAAQLPAQVDRLLAGGFDILQIKRLGGLRAELRRRLESGTDGDLEQALRLTAQILAVEPVDEEALRLRLDLCRHLDRADDFRATLAGLPRDRLDADLANALAWDRLVDEDLAWRHLDLALPLARHARALSPDSGAICDTLARAYYLLGMLDEAIAEQLTAVSLDDDPALRAVLAYYQQALALAKQVRRGVDLPGGRALPGVIVP